MTARTAQVLLQAADRTGQFDPHAYGIMTGDTTYTGTDLITIEQFAGTDLASLTRPQRDATDQFQSADGHLESSRSRPLGLGRIRRRIRARRGPGRWPGLPAVRSSNRHPQVLRRDCRGVDEGPCAAPLRELHLG
jgi:hypothetical protein